MDRRQLVAMAEEITYDVRMLTGTAVRQQIERAELERSAQLDTGRTRVVSSRRPNRAWSTSATSMTSLAGQIRIT